MSKQAFSVEVSGGTMLYAKMLQIAEGLADAMGSDERAIEMRTFHQEPCPAVDEHKIALCTCTEIRIEGHLLSDEEKAIAIERVGEGIYEEVDS